jgi:hypothetical protein
MNEAIEHSTTRETYEFILTIMSWKALFSAMAILLYVLSTSGDLL